MDELPWRRTVMRVAPARDQWPALVYDEWKPTLDTLHAHTQVLGKLSAVLARPEPQLQHTALRLSARGWETLALPAPDGSGALTVALDLRAHEVVLEHTDGSVRRVALTPNRPVAEVTRDVLDAARALGGTIEIDPKPQEVPWTVPLDEDREHATYDERYPKAAFYAYAHPLPAGFAASTLDPPAARWEENLAEYVLDWDDVRVSPDPYEAALEFARSAFRRLCAVCGWDRTLVASAEGTPPPVS